MNIRLFIKNLFPKKYTKKIYQIFKFFIRIFKYTFKGYDVNDPVVQIYICNKDIKSYLSVNNFLSYFSPKINSNGFIKIILYSNDGKKKISERYKLKNLETEYIDISKIIKKYNFDSEFGIITSVFYPSSRYSKKIREFGTVSNQPYIFYRDKNQSMGMVHALSTFGSQSPSPQWKSNQAISTEKLDNLFLYQCNPSFNDFKLTYSFLDIKKNYTITSTIVKIPKKGVAKVSFKDKIKLLKDYKYIQLYCNSGLPSCNSKPILFREFKKGFYSISHT